LADELATAPSLGFGAAAILDPWRFPVSTPFYWSKLSENPVRAIFSPNDSATNLSVQFVGEVLRTREVVSTGNDGPFGPATCRPRLEIDAQARLRSEDGALDEVVPVHVVAHSLGLAHVLFDLPWADLSGALEVSAIEYPQHTPAATLEPIAGHFVLTGGRTIGQIGSSLTQITGNPPLKQFHRFSLGDASLDDPFCTVEKRVALPLTTSVGSVSGSDVVDRLRNLEPWKIALPDGSSRIGRVMVPNLPDRSCLELGNGYDEPGGDFYLAADVLLLGEDGLTALLNLPAVQIIAEPVPIASAFSLFLRYDALSLESEDAATFLARHGLRDIVLEAHSFYSLSANAFVDHTGKVGGFLQINGLERDPGCTPESPGCDPEIAKELWRANLVTDDR
jgi:hypothetical protein